MSHQTATPHPAQQDRKIRMLAHGFVCGSVFPIGNGDNPNHACRERQSWQRQIAAPKQAIPCSIGPRRRERCTRTEPHFGQWRTMFSVAVMIPPNAHAEFEFCLPCAVILVREDRSDGVGRARPLRSASPIPWFAIAGRIPMVCSIRVSRFSN